ncbi:MAG: dTDP-glucose 4,6-dehydratase [Balneolales bacterium]
MHIIITGGAGFIGSNLILHLMDTYPDYHILNLDKLSYASDPAYLKRVENNARYNFLHLDLVNRKMVRDAIRDFKPDGIFHLAAESHVDNSIDGPEPFVMSNVVATFNILEEFRQYQTGSGKPGDARFLHVSTDEVYGSLGPGGFFTEKSPYAPNSPYSATKAGSDFLVRSYYHTYSMNVITTNCSNNYGPHQHDEKLIPTVIRSALRHEPIPIYGKGDNIRDWLYVEDHCRALDLAFHDGKAGETYVIGGHNEWKNIDLVRQICRIMNAVTGEGPEGDYQNLMSFTADRPGHDQRYAIDPSRIESELGWRPTGTFLNHLENTVRWYIDRYKE